MFEFDFHVGTGFGAASCEGATRLHRNSERKEGSWWCNAAGMVVIGLKFIHQD